MPEALDLVTAATCFVIWGQTYGDKCFSFNGIVITIYTVPTLPCTSAKHNLSLPIGYTGRCKPQIRRPHTLILHLHVVIENCVRKHDLELASSKEASGTGTASMSEQQELWGGGDHIVFPGTILQQPHFREAKAVKLIGVVVLFWIIVSWRTIDTDCGSLGNKGAVGECVILLSNSPH